MRDLRFYTTCKYQVRPVTVSEMSTEDMRLLDEKLRTLFMANLTMCTSFFQVFPALRSDGDNAEYSPARSCSHGGSYTGGLTYANFAKDGDIIFIIQSGKKNLPLYPKAICWTNTLEQSPGQMASQDMSKQNGKLSLNKIF